MVHLFKIRVCQNQDSVNLKVCEKGEVSNLANNGWEQTPINLKTDSELLLRPIVLTLKQQVVSNANSDPLRPHKQPHLQPYQA